MKHNLKQTDVVYFQKGIAISTLTNGMIVKSFSYDEYYVIQEDVGSGEARMKKMSSDQIFDNYKIDIKLILPSI